MTSEARQKILNDVGQRPAAIHHEPAARRLLPASATKTLASWHLLLIYLALSMTADLSSLSSSSENNNNENGQHSISKLRHYLARRQPLVLAAEASSLYLANQDRGIIILNSTNFNTELIQHRQPFPHIKLIEYYVSFCGICAKFKATYTKLAREIQPWRNVIRPSAIDLGVSNNSPIAHSWSVTVVPTLRIHPPPTPALAEKLDQQLSTWQAILPQAELQRSMFSEYNSSELMIHSLSVANYMDKVQLLKDDLLRYIERYVRDSPHTMPATWPNLRPVAETRLADLLRDHPRQELFLLVEGPSSSSSSSPRTTSISTQPSSTATSYSDQSSSSFGLSVMMELSSSAPWKAVRWVRASENKALIEDVIELQKRILGEQNTSQEQVELLKAFMADNKPGSFMLIHIDASHTPIRTSSSSSSSATALPYMTMVTGAELLSNSESLSSLNEARAKRADNNQHRPASKAINQARRKRRSLFDINASSPSSSSAMFDKMTSEQKVDLVTEYIKHTYSETKEDREFVEAINNLTNDNNNNKQDNSEQTDSSSKAIEKFIKSHQTISDKSRKSNFDADDSTTSTTAIDEQQSSLLDKVSSLFTPSSSTDSKQKVGANRRHMPGSDYDDKLKAIHYMLFNEVPRTPFNDKSLAKQQEKLATLVNLVSVIKTYFPLPDSSSVQFIDGVQSYLVKQQAKLLSANNDQQPQRARELPSFDARAFKQELKRLEADDKRLPEVQDWSYCINSGYPCALWRLFHTLAAFEYKKLSQIRQQPPAPAPPQTTRQQQQQAPPVETGTSLQQSDNNLSPSVEAITIKSMVVGDSSFQSPPVERLVSPPSTTTSLSLTIAAVSPTATSLDSNSNNNNNINNSNDLPAPVILVMRDYITTFYSCEDCRRHFRQEAAELSFERLRHHETPSFSMLWLWDVHNRVNKRLAMDTVRPDTQPKVWFPTYEQCSTCYKKPPSFNGKSVDQIIMFQESIDWNKEEILCYLLREYTRHPLDNYGNLFGYQVPLGFGYILVASIVCLILVVVLRCCTLYIERQRRHKATLLNGNGNGAHYSLALQ